MRIPKLRQIPLLHPPLTRAPVVQSASSTNQSMPCPPLTLPKLCNVRVRQHVLLNVYMPETCKNYESIRCQMQTRAHLDKVRLALTWWFLFYFPLLRPSSFRLSHPTLPSLLRGGMVFRGGAPIPQAHWRHMEVSLQTLRTSVCMKDSLSGVLVRRPCLKSNPGDPSKVVDQGIEKLNNILLLW